MNRAFCLVVLCLGVLLWHVAVFADAPVQVKITDDKPVEVVLPLDPVKAVTYQAVFGLGVVVRVDNQTMHLGQLTTFFKIDNQLVFPNRAVQPIPLPKTPSGKVRDGVMQTFQHGKLDITQTIEVVPGKPAKPKDGQKRRLDTVLVRYTIENKDTQPHEFGTRIYMNTMIVNNRSAQFAAPNHDKLLNGVELKDGKVPPYLQVLQNPDLKNPGVTGTFTYRFNKTWEMPNRVVMTMLGAGRDGWNFNAQPGGLTALAFYWDPKVIKPGGKRELAYAYGGGIASTPENEGQVHLVLGGSFEPGKIFTLAAKVDDPAPGQNLTLELPPGMERVEGKECQPVAVGAEENINMVLWKARVVRPGEYRVRVRSSTGVTLTKIISITKS